MTTVSTGGGPTIEERRAFAGLKKGSHLPGYRGYCNQLKFRVGNTYGNETHLLFKDQKDRTTVACEKLPAINPDRLPEPTGDNKYTRDMVPGYTGYVPSMFSKYGATYKEKCDECVSEFLTDVNTTFGKSNALRKTIEGYPRYKTKASEARVNEHMKSYTDTQLLKPADAHRSMLEPPMPGYHGNVPRKDVTEMGLGSRYHTVCLNSLQMYANERRSRVEAERQPIDMRDRQVRSVAKSTPDFSRRVYVQDGMIPNFTGYIPQRRFVYGQTYGDTTRGLEVCYHGDECFGEHSKKFPTVKSVMC